MKMFMEKSWNMKYWPKVIEFCYQSWNLTYFALKLYQFCRFFDTTEKLSIDVKSLHFPTFSAKCRECKIENRDVHGKLKNGHGKIMKQYFVKSVGTLPSQCTWLLLDSSNQSEIDLMEQFYLTWVVPSLLPKVPYQLGNS